MKIPAVIKNKFENMKYRHKLTILLVTASLVPMILLVLYSHDRMSSLLREKEMEDMSSILEQTGEGIDSQIEVFSSLLNYLTYSPDIEDLITEKNMDNYQAYRKYTEVADPLLSVPKSYHDAIIQIQLFAESIKVRHEYTLVPLSEVDKEWWYDKLEEDVSVQWVVDSQIPEIAAVRRIYTGREQTAVLCVTLDYNKIFQPFEKIISAESGGMILDKGGNVLFQKEMLGEKEEKDSGEAVSREFLESGQGDYAFVNRKNAACGWIFYLYKLQSAVDSSVSGILVSEIPLIAACVAIILVLGLSFSRLFTRKIEELTDNMNRVNQGSREVTVDSNAGDEIGLLVRSFRSMMDEINRLIHEVYENKIALKEFELKALTAQINPHFLYNTLFSIRCAVEVGKNEQAAKMLSAFIDLLRSTLAVKNTTIPLSDELETTRKYLVVQKLRYGEKINYEIEMPKDTEDCMVPPLILQPLVENAIFHGLEAKSEAGTVIIESAFQGNNLLLTITDDGVGMDSETLEKVRASLHQTVIKDAHSIGMSNVHNRIRLNYGEDYGMSIDSFQGMGTTITLLMPAIKQKEEIQ